MPCKESVYGKRDGYMSGVAVLHRDRANIFRATAGFKKGVIYDIQMLNRQSMFKPEVPVL